MGVVIKYNIEVLNKTSNAYTYIDTIESTYFHLTCSSNCSTACDDIEFVVIPMNELELGNSSILPQFRRSFTMRISLPIILKMICQLVLRYGLQIFIPSWCIILQLYSGKYFVSKISLC